MERTNTDEVTPIRNMAVFTFHKAVTRQLSVDEW
jgi:hypothetical protein